MTVDTHSHELAANKVSFSERFEKTRLAVLTYSAVSIIISLAAFDHLGEVSSLPFGALDLDVVKLLAILAATIYLAVFLKFDVPASRNLNRNIFYGVEWDQIPARLRKIEADLLAQTNGVSGLRAAHVEFIGWAESQLEKLRSIIKQAADRNLLDEVAASFPSEYAALSARLDNIEATGRRGLTSMPHEYWQNEVSNYVRHLEALAGQVEQVIQSDHEFVTSPEVIKMTEQELAAFGAVFEKLKAFSESIEPKEISRFNWWEVRAPVALWLIGITAVVGSLYNDLTGRRWVWLTPPPPHSASAPAVHPRPVQAPDSPALAPR